MARRVTEEEWRREAAWPFTVVFASTNVYEGEPFTDGLPRRSLLAGPPTQRVRESLAAAAHAVGDDGAYLLHLHDDEDAAWWVDPAEPWPESGGGGVALVSPSGQWGLLATSLFADFAAVGWAAAAFERALFAGLPGPHEQALETLAALDAVGLLGPGWVDALLAHVYGLTEAGRLLEDHHERYS